MNWWAWCGWQLAILFAAMTLLTSPRVQTDGTAALSILVVAFVLMAVNFVVWRPWR